MSRTICIQCSLKAMLDGKDAPIFNEDIEQHMAKHHPDPDETLRQRVELERRIAELTDTISLHRLADRLSKEPHDADPGPLLFDPTVRNKRDKKDPQ